MTGQDKTHTVSLFHIPSITLPSNWSRSVRIPKDNLQFAGYDAWILLLLQVLQLISFYFVCLKC